MMRWTVQSQTYLRPYSEQEILRQKMIHLQDSERLRRNSSTSQLFHRNDRQTTSSVRTRIHGDKPLDPFARPSQQRQHPSIPTTLILTKTFLISTFNKKSRTSKTFSPNSHIENYGTPLCPKNKVTTTRCSGLLIRQLTMR